MPPHSQPDVLGKSVATGLWTHRKFKHAQQAKESTTAEIEMSKAEQNAGGTNQPTGARGTEHRRYQSTYGCSRNRTERRRYQSTYGRSRNRTPAVPINLRALA